VSTPATRLERSFDADAISRLDGDVLVGGPGLAVHAFRAGLVDLISVIVVPTMVGGGTAALPAGVGLRLELLDERRFASGFVALSYAVTR
jgi:riboflavin biosynthesis pyrimidine reductase